MPTAQHKSHSPQQVERGPAGAETGASHGSAATARRRRPRGWLLIAAIFVVAVGAAAWFTRGEWLAAVQRLATLPEASGRGGDDHVGHAHAAEGEAVHNEAAQDHAGHVEETSIRLSEQGRKNVGLTLATVEQKEFERTVSMPGMLVERPGRSELAISAPMTGVVRRIFPIRGEAVSPGDPLFELRLTHEDLVEKQSALLQAVEELDVVRREVARLEEVTRSGAIAGKQLLERQYEQQKIEGVIRAERQALLLHGLSEEQIDRIIDQRRLLQSLVIEAPELVDCGQSTEHPSTLQVAELLVMPGEHVSAGTRLGTLSDHCQLYVEGKAFEDDAEVLNRAANEHIPITATIDAGDSRRHEVSGLRILYVENQVETASRALKFYLRLPNELIRNELTEAGQRFVGWRYKPGQRVEVLVPIQRWPDRLVVPVESVVQEGAESYVYQQIGGHFDRRTVRVEHRDQRFAVIENDGTLFPGDVVAAKGAYQIHLALKNKAGGGADPHAGHHH